MKKFLSVFFIIILLKRSIYCENRYVSRINAFMNVTDAIDFYAGSFNQCSSHCLSQKKNVVNWYMSKKICRCIDRYNVYAIIKKIGWKLFEFVKEDVTRSAGGGQNILSLGYLPKIYWLQHDDICIGNLNDRFGSFTVKVDGVLAAVKLVHKSGELHCGLSYQSRWSCSHHHVIFLEITGEDRNDPVLPTDRSPDTDMDFGYAQDYLTLYPSVERRYLHKGDVLKVWNYEDLNDYNEAGNGNGYLCVKTYLLLEYMF